MVWSHWARLSSMLIVLVLFGVRAHRLHHPLHAHEARPFDQHAGETRQRLQHGGIQRLDGGEMPARTIALHRVRALLTSPISPSTNRRGPGRPASTSMAARTESGLAL